MFNIDLNTNKVAQKRVLGRGLDALIPEKEKRKSGAEIEVNKIIPNTFQPRKNFDTAELENLVRSIKERGIIQPVIVRSKGDQYELVAGERRYRAAKVLGLPTVPAVIKELTDREMLEFALIENIQREDLDPIEKAEAFARLMSEFGLTHDEMAKRIGQERSSVTNTLRLLKLPETIKAGISQKKISMSQARTLLALKTEADQLELYEKITSEPVSVRELENIVSDIRIVDPGQKLSRRKHKKNPELSLLEDELREKWGAKIIVKGNNKKGRIEIHYFSLDDLDRILARLKRSV